MPPRACRPSWLHRLRPRHLYLSVVGGIRLWLRGHDAGAHVDLVTAQRVARRRLAPLGENRADLAAVAPSDRFAGRVVHRDARRVVAAPRADELRPVAHAGITLDLEGETLALAPQFRKGHPGARVEIPARHRSHQ